MKVTVYTESVPGTLNYRYFCELEDGDVKVKREGRDSVKQAAESAVEALKWSARQAEATLKKMGIL